MSTPLSSAQLLRIFRECGVSYVTRTGWGTHNRASKGPWGPVHGVMIHHTGPYATERDVLNYLWDGTPVTLPGPLCLAGVPKDGVLHMTGWGRANHAGTGDPAVLAHVIAEDYTTLPAPRFGNGEKGGADGNRYFYGFELLNQGSGADPWPEAQLDAVARAAAGICAKHGWTERSVIGHLEWQKGKVDPRGFTMASFRARVKSYL